MFASLLLALFLILSPLAALASADGVRCVQQQLVAAGQDPGPIDGVVGGRTRQALSLHAQARGLDRARRLDIDTAIPWCRRLGIEDSALRAYWPSRLNQVIVDVAGSVDTVLARLIRTRMPGIHADVAQRLGVELAGTDHVIVGSGPVELRREILRAGFTQIGNLDAILLDHCEPDRPIGGFALPGLMVICLEPEIRLRGGISYSYLTFVLAHEATHLVQFQLTGLPPRGTSAAGRVPLEGPIWLLEGQADLIGYAVGYDTGPAAARINAVQRYEGQALPALARLQDRNALRAHRADVYRVGMIAASLLVEDQGHEVVTSLFAAMGDGTPFPEAFEASYGESLTAFYDGFEERARRAAGPDALSSASESGTGGRRITAVFRTPPAFGATPKP